MDPLINLIWGVGTVTVSAIVVVYVGRRRGIDQVEQRADGEVQKLIAAQASRLSILEAENRRLGAEVASLTAQLATMRSDLEMERRISARFRSPEDAIG